MIKSLSITLASMLLLSCRSKGTTETFERIVYISEVHPIGYVEKSYSAVVASQEQTTLAFQMGGEVINIYISTGDQVSKGDKIASVNPTDYQIDMEAAKAQYLTAQSDLERYQRLLQKDVISKQQYEAISATYASRKSIYLNSLEVLKNTTLYAPFNGMIEETYVDIFQRVQPFQNIVKLINPDSLEMSFTISPQDYKIMNAPEVHYYVQFDAYPKTKFNARLKRSVDISIGGEGYPMLVTIDDSIFSLEQYKIKSGNSCTVIMAIEDSNNDVMAIPITALYGSKSSHGREVWLYDPTTSQVKLTPIITGELSGSDMIAVTDGLEEGDKVVTAGIYQLTNNEKVKVLPTPKY